MYGGGAYDPGNGYLGAENTKVVIPQYIKGEEDKEFLPVDSMDSTFKDNGTIKSILEITSAVVDMDWAFNGYSNFAEVPLIHNNIISMDHKFSGCRTLVEALEIPNSVINMVCTFQDCESLIKSPSSILIEVKSLYNTFKNCKLLKSLQ